MTEYMWQASLCLLRLRLAGL